MSSIEMLDRDTFTEPVRGILTRHSLLLLPLTRSADCKREDAKLLERLPPQSVFPGARNPEAALSGLLLLLGCWDESHRLSQDLSSVEGSYWHAIAHRIEPDAGNSGYWFRRVGQHPIFPELHRQAAEILDRRNEKYWRLKQAWDPFLFIGWCEEARREPDSRKERIALEIQQAEWRLLFEWCAG